MYCIISPYTSKRTVINTVSLRQLTKFKENLQLNSRYPQLRCGERPMERPVQIRYMHLGGLIRFRRGDDSAVTDHEPSASSTRRESFRSSKLADPRGGQQDGGASRTAAVNPCSSEPRDSYCSRRCKQTSVGLPRVDGPTGWHSEHPRISPRITGN